MFQGFFVVFVFYINIIEEKSFLDVGIKFYPFLAQYGNVTFRENLNETHQTDEFCIKEKKKL